MIAENATNYIGRNLRVSPKLVTLDQFRSDRLGKFSNDAAITSLNEFTVNKISVRHGNEPVSRIFAMSETCVVERDPAGDVTPPFPSCGLVRFLVASLIPPNLPPRTSPRHLPPTFGARFLASVLQLGRMREPPSKQLTGRVTYLATQPVPHHPVMAQPTRRPRTRW
jgi:hypothetical protein